jgi:glycosyltransferase involved in cell wall biosynthesis
LVGNYPNDGQESMRRFGDLLAGQLPDYGIQAEYLYPLSVFGRFHPGADGLGKWLGYMDKFLLFPRKLRNRVHTLSADSVAHICDHSNAVYTRVLASVPHLVTCHDLLAVRAGLGEIPGCRPRASGRLYQRWILRGLNAAKWAACVSKATRRDLLRLSRLGSHQVSLVHNGLNHPYAPVPDSDAAVRLAELTARLGYGVEAKLPTGFILHVGGNQWYKNRLGVIQIYARLREKMSNPPNLVLAGKPLTPELRQCILSLHLEGRVIELNSVSNEDLRTLYSSAQLLLFPSFEEGFGWPIVEAQACGCRVVVADREPMTEIGADAAVCFEMESAAPHAAASLSTRAVENGASAVKKTLQESPEARLDRIRNGISNAARFTTNRMVESYIDLYRQILRTGLEPYLRKAYSVSPR